MNMGNAEARFEELQKMMLETNKDMQKLQEALSPLPRERRKPKQQWWTCAWARRKDKNSRDPPCRQVR